MARKRTSTQLRLDSLDQRQLPSITLTPVVEGTAGADNIRIIDKPGAPGRKLVRRGNTNLDASDKRSLTSRRRNPSLAAILM